ncbi:hypothetical protein LTR27_007719 [Elasticomyces elasticus]|nr:hypothetical protein LTR27_007719 [Elasticomyces elasticus]
MNPTSSYLQTVLNTLSPPPSSSSLRRSIPIPSTPFSNLLIPTSTTLKSRHVRLNSSPSSSSSEGTFDGSDRSPSSVSASIRDLRSRCSSKGTETAGDDWPEDAWTLGGRFLSLVEMEGADVGFRLGWLEDGGEDEDDAEVDAEESEDEAAEMEGICVMAILPSIENEDGYAPSRKRPLEDAAEGSRKCRRLAAIIQPQHAGDAAGEATAADQPLEDAAERSSERRRGGAGNYWDPVRDAAALENAADGSRKCLRLATSTGMRQAGDAGDEGGAVVGGWTAINHPPARFSARYLGS